MRHDTVLYFVSYSVRSMHFNALIECIKSQGANLREL